jgi:predicted dehydrogenase
MTKLLKAGVIGAGVFGGYHAKKFVELEGVELIGVFDPDLARASALTAPLRASAFASLEALLDAVDVVAIASPGVLHAQQGLAALKAGRGVYIEKPLATQLDEADALVAEAARRKLVLAAGHQERAVFQAMGLFDIPERPLRLEAVRTGPPQARCLDVSVVLDLMIHDLDLALVLAGGEVIAVEGEGRRVNNDSLDEVRAEATFSDGFTAVLEASRVAEGRTRTMKVIYPSGEVEIDFMTRAFRNSTPFALNEQFAETPQGRDPLGTSVRAFLAAVRGDAARPLATGEEAARALDLALAVEQAGEAGF